MYSRVWKGCSVSVFVVKMMSAPSSAGVLWVFCYKCYYNIDAFFFHWKHCPVNNHSRRRFQNITVMLFWKHCSLIFLEAVKYLLTT